MQQNPKIGQAPRDFMTNAKKPNIKKTVFFLFFNSLSLLNLKMLKWVSLISHCFIKLKVNIVWNFCIIDFN